MPNLQRNNLKRCYFQLWILYRWELRILTAETTEEVVRIFYARSTTISFTLLIKETFFDNCFKRNMLDFFDSVHLILQQFNRYLRDLKTELNV